MHLDWTILWGDPGLLILQGLLVTLQLSAWTLLFAFLIGLVVGTVRWLGFKVTEPCAGSTSSSRAIRHR